MQITIAGIDQFNDESLFAQAFGAVVIEEMKKKVRSTSLEVKAEVQRQMPVDTGAARARWGSKGRAGGVWLERDNGLTIEQGGDLAPFEYIIRLNEGSSRQAPAGFLDVIAERSGDDLIEAVVDSVEDRWNG